MADRQISLRAPLRYSNSGPWKSRLAPVAEQKHILAAVDRSTAGIDTLIEAIRDALTHLRELRTALISAAVTGKIDVRGEVA